MASAIPMPLVPQMAPQEAAAADKQMASWSPTVVAIAGEDYVVLGCDTRLSTGFSILSRKFNRILQLSDKVVMGTSGFAADTRYLHKQLHVRHVLYLQDHGRPMSVQALAQQLSRTLYYRRFFPLYTFNTVAGLGADGKGYVYSYDAVGNKTQVAYDATGTGSELIRPILINGLGGGNDRLMPPEPLQVSLPLEQALDVVKTAFTGAGERDIYTGDSVEIVCLTKDGIKRETLELKKD